MRRVLERMGLLNMNFSKYSQQTNMFWDTKITGRELITVVSWLRVSALGFGTTCWQRSSMLTAEDVGLWLADEFMPCAQSMVVR